jgi:hypothetical protein
VAPDRRDGRSGDDAHDGDRHVANLACDVAGSADEVEEYAAGGSGLQNLGDGHYQFNWKTPTSYAKTCKTLKLDLGEASGPHTAAFQFRK